MSILENDHQITSLMVFISYSYLRAYVDPTLVLLLNGPMGPLALDMGHFGLKLKLWKKKEAYNRHNVSLKLS